MDEIIKQLDQIYGPGKGTKVYNTIMPGIFSDFNNMLKKVPVGREISEEYRLEDGKASVIVKGMRKTGNDYTISATLQPATFIRSSGDSSI